MKISKKILNFIMSIFVLATTFTFANAFPSKVFADELPPVQLYYSASVSDSAELGHCVGYIAVKNLGYDKKVTVHYNTPASSTVWSDIDATYVGTNASDGYEIWRFETPTTYSLDGLGDIQYAIRYEVNGQTYWDNNNGKNYQTNDFTASRPHVISTVKSYENNQQFLNVYIGTKKSVSPDAVRLRYTEDNWATYSDVDAVSTNEVFYNYDTNCWVAKIPISSGKQVQFSAYYELNGNQYWDNNLGSNYAYNN